MPEVFSQPKIKAERRSPVFEQLTRQKVSGLFHSFQVAPSGVSFETQEKGEKIILLLRQHPIVNLGWLLIAGALILVPAFWELLPFDFLPARFQVMTVVLWYLLVLAFVLEQFLNWYFNVYIVTDERVVDIDFNGLIYRDLTVTKINNVQDVNFTQMGALAAFFNYGDVYVQTAGERREFDFLRVPQPNKVVDILYKLMEEEEQEALEGRVK